MKAVLDAAIAQLDDYVRGQLSEELASDYEEDLFARALSGQAPELVFRSGLAKAFKIMAARGTLDLWLTARDVERVRATGVRIVDFTLDLENPIGPNLPAEFDLLVTKIPVDLTGVRRLDAEVFTPSGQLLKRMPEIAFDPTDKAVYACCEADLARAAASVTTITRVWAEDDSGRRLLAEIAPP